MSFQVLKILPSFLVFKKAVFTRLQRASNRGYDSYKEKYDPVIVLGLTKYFVFLCKKNDSAVTVLIMSAHAYGSRAVTVAL